jgi:ribosomal-protein-alanine N-acetyltransferase
MEIRLTSVADAALLSEFYRKNADHLREWEPLREANYHSPESWRDRLVKWEKERSEGIAAHFILLNPIHYEVVAICSLTNIVRGPFQACNMGYSVSLSHQGKGNMKMLCNHVINYAFGELGLHRIMANYMPKNHRSEVLLNRLGFSREGLAKKYLKINGYWEDHVLTSLLDPAHE